MVTHFPIKSVDQAAIEMKKELFEKMDCQCKLNVVVLEIEAMYSFIRERIGDDQVIKQTRAELLMADYKKALDNGVVYHDYSNSHSDVLLTIEYIRAAVDIILGQHSSTDKAHKRNLFSPEQGE